jgi:chromosome segregation ATPase
MRLLSPTQLKKENPTPQINKAEQILKVVKAAEQALHEHKVKRDLIKNQIELEFLEFAQNIDSKRKGLKQEVEKIEQRKEEALKPIAELKDSLQARQDTLDKLFVEVQHKEDDLIKREQQVNILTQDVHNLFQEYTTHQSQFDGKLIALKAQELAVKEQYQLLSKQWDSFFTTTQESQAKLLAWSEVLQGKEALLTSLQEGVKTQQEELIEVRRQINDERATLERAWGEFRNKLINNG